MKPSEVPVQYHFPSLLSKTIDKRVLSVHCFLSSSEYICSVCVCFCVAFFFFFFFCKTLLILFIKCVMFVPLTESDHIYFLRHQPNAHVITKFSLGL